MKVDRFKATNHAADLTVALPNNKTYTNMKTTIWSKITAAIGSLFGVTQGTGAAKSVCAVAGSGHKTAKVTVYIDGKHLLMRANKLGGHVDVKKLLQLLLNGRKFHGGHFFWELFRDVRVKNHWVVRTGYTSRPPA